MGRTDMLHLFPLLKSKAKVKETDQIWEKICDKLNWIYISSILDEE